MTPMQCGARFGRRFSAQVRATRPLPDERAALISDAGRYLAAFESGATVAIEPCAQQDADTLRVLVDNHERCLVWCADQGLEALLMQMRRVPTLPPLVLSLDVGDRLPRDARRRLTDWFNDEFILDGGVVAYVGRGTFDPRGAFSLLGRSSRWEVQFEDGELRVLKSRRDQRRRAPTIWLRLDELPRVFREDQRDASAALDGAVRAVSATSNYFDIWTQYQEAEIAFLAEQAKRLGPLEFVEHTLDQKRRHRRFRLKTLPDAWQGLETRPSLRIEDGPRVGSVSERPRRHDGEWWIATDDIEERPPEASGTLVIDQHGDARRIERSKEALAKLRNDDTRLSRLAAVLDGEGRDQRVDPRRDWSSASVRAQLGGRRPTAAQQRAIEVALATPDVALIQGPPGTGKTTVIRAITNRLHDLGRRPVLLTSYQHEAVLRAVEGVVVAGVPAVRLGGRRGEDASLRLQPMRDWIAEIEDRSAASLRASTAPAHLIDLRRARRRLLHHLQTQATLDACEHMLAEVRALLARCADASIIKALGHAEQTFDRLQRPSAVPTADPAAIREQLRQQLREAGHFADGGWQRARRLRRVALGLPLTDDVRATLEAACNVGASIPTGFEAALDAIEQLLDAPPDDADPLAEMNTALRAFEAAIAAAIAAHPPTIPDALAGFLDRLDTYRAQLPAMVSRYTPAIGATLQQAVGRDVSDWHVEFDTVIVDEAARANPLDLLIPLTRGRRLILVGDQNQLPHMLEPQLEDALDAGAGGEAGRVLRESFFGRLWDRYAQAPPGAIPRCVRLDKQFRMHPTIGRFISEQFYGGGLSNGVTAADRPAIRGAFGGKPIAWFDVPRGAEQGRYHRPSEVDQVAHLVDIALRGEPQITIGVISFYRQQVERLRRRARRAGWPRQVEVGTVDAFQGKEFDCVILSTVRRGKRVGFLRLPNRLNVAMSRAMRALVVVGDSRTVTQIPSLAALEALCRREGHHVGA